MKSKVVILTTILATTALSVPVTAQIRNPSQDFFEQGREQLEREIQSLQGDPPNSEQNPQKPKSEPLLEVSPSPTKEPDQKPSENEAPSHKPNELNNRKS